MIVSLASYPPPSPTVIGWSRIEDPSVRGVQDRMYLRREDHCDDAKFLQLIQHFYMTAILKAASISNFGPWPVILRGFP
jgi:hypothetical protein